MSVDREDMVVDGGAGDSELVGDLFFGVALDKEGEDFESSGGE